MLFVLPACQPSWGTNQARLLLPHLLAAGYDVQACTLSARLLLCSTGAVDVDRRPRAARSRGLAPTAASYHSAGSAMGPRLAADFRARVAVLAADLSRVPWIVSQSGFQPAGTWLQSHAERQHLHSIVTWTVSQPGLAESRWPADCQAPACTESPAVSSPAGPPEQSRAAWLESFALPSGAASWRRGRLQFQGRWKDLIWAADMLKFIRDDVHLLICGTGPSGGGWSDSAGCGNRRQSPFSGTRHLPGWLPHLDVFWSGRDDHGQPLALLMAMAAGVPSSTARAAPSR